MPVALLTISDWSTTDRSDTLIANPSWSQVELAVRSLNESNLNDLYLQPDANNAETYLCIGGGAGRYILSGSLNGESFPTLVDPARSSTPRAQLMVGGQIGDYPTNWIMDLSTTLQAAMSFFEAGGFNCGLVWSAV